MEAMTTSRWVHAVRALHYATMYGFGNDFHMLLACRAPGKKPRCLAYRSPTTALRFDYSAMEAVTSDEVALLVIRCDGMEFSFPVGSRLTVRSVRSDVFTDSW